MLKILHLQHSKNIVRYTKEGRQIFYLFNIEDTREHLIRKMAEVHQCGEQKAAKAADKRWNDFISETELYDRKHRAIHPTVQQYAKMDRVIQSYGTIYNKKTDKFMRI